MVRDKRLGWLPGGSQSRQVIVKRRRYGRDRQKSDGEFAWQITIRRIGVSVELENKYYWERRWAECYVRTHVCLLSESKCWFTSMLWFNVLLHQPYSVELQLADWWSQVFQQNVFINSEIIFSITNSNLSSPWGSKAALNHDAPLMPIFFFSTQSNVFSFQIIQIWFHPSTKYFASRAAEHAGALLQTFKHAAMFYGDSNGILLALLP